MRKPGGAPQQQIGRVVPAAFYKTTQQLRALEVIEREKKIGSPQGPNYEAYLGKNATPICLQGMPDVRLESAAKVCLLGSAWSKNCLVCVLGSGC